MDKADGKNAVPHFKDGPPAQPISGPPVQYSFIAGGKTSDVLFPVIKEYHRCGRRLLILKKKPLSEYYVGIFREPSANEDRGEWTLGNTRLWLHGQLRSQPPPLQPANLKMRKEEKRKMWVTDPLCLADAIAQNFQCGEQIVCISMTTEQLSYSRKAIPEGAKVIPGHTKTVWCPHDEQLPFDGKKNRDAVMVEVFFERPLRGPRERFVYNLATVPVTIMHDDRYLGLSSIFCDWSGHFNQYLNQGWKLVDIFVDFRRPPEDVESLVMNQFQYTYGSGDDEVTVKTREPINTDTLWLFEKPASREHDPTPVYEGQIVSFAFDAPSGGRNPTVYWDNVIGDMGQRGWELACFVERSSSHPGESHLKFYSLLFFQRLLPPPQYTDLDPSAAGGRGADVFLPKYSEKTAL